MIAKQILRQLFKMAADVPFNVVFWDGSKELFGAGEPRFTLTIHDEHILDLFRSDIELGFADAYMDGKIDVEGDIGEMIALATALVHRYESEPEDSLIKRFGRISAALTPRSLKKQTDDVRRHYDLGNDFYRLWLDESMTYSCAYFKNPDDTIERAQIQKIDHTLRKVRLKPGETLLDIGSGWGALIMRAGENYGVRALGITLSEQQYGYTCPEIHVRDLEDKVDVRLIDYQTLAKSGQRFDKIVSVGMMEHVGKAHLSEYAQSVKTLLKPGGLALLHFITSPKEGPFCAWMDRDIFPGAYLPTVPEALQHFYSQNLRILDVENLRAHYQMTLDRWSERFEAQVPKIREMFGEPFVRMWRMYLRMSSASFREGIVEIHQVLVSNGVPTDLPLTRDDLYR